MRISAAQLPLPFPVRVRPCTGELFRSLLVRVAHAHGEKIQSFGFRLTGRGRQLFGDDVDRGRWTALIDVFAQRTGIPTGAVISTTLRAYEGTLFGELPWHGTARWVLHIGQSGTYRRWSGLQFCPACLAKDGEPHFKLTWRLAFSVWCESHLIRLRDRCPNCDGPVAIHRYGVGAPTAGRQSPLTHCPLCGHDRRAGPRISATETDRAALTLQLQMRQVLDDGWATIGGRSVHPLAYFTGMSMLWSFLDDPKRSDVVWADVLGDLPRLPTKPDNFRFGSIEHLGLEERNLLLRACAVLLKDGVPGLIDTLSRAGLSSDKLLRYCGRDRARPPFWLWEPIRLGLDKTMYVPSIEEIDAAIDHLRRTSDDGYLRIRDVCALIGMRTNHSARVAARMRGKSVVRPRHRTAMS